MAAAGGKVIRALPSRLNQLPQELLCQIVQEVGTPIHYDDLLNLIAAYPRMMARINDCVTEIDFTDGVSIVDKTGRGIRQPDKLVNIQFTNVDLKVMTLKGTYPRLALYRIAIAPQLILISDPHPQSRAAKRARLEDDSTGIITTNEVRTYDLTPITRFLLDSRARWLHIQLKQLLDGFDQYSELLEVLAIGISKRIERYGADFTIVFQAYNGFILNFAYHNRILHFENTVQLFDDDDEDEAITEMNLHWQLRLFKLFEPLVEVIGADHSGFLNALFINYRTAIPATITKVYLNSFYNENSFGYINEDSPLNRGSEFFKYLTEIRHNSETDGPRVKFYDSTFLEELRVMNVVYPNIIVMELPIRVKQKQSYQHYFPNVVRFVFVETLIIAQYEQEIAALKQTMVQYDV